MAALDQRHHFFHRHVFFRQRHIDVRLVTLDPIHPERDTGIDHTFPILPQGNTTQHGLLFPSDSSKLKRK